MIATEETAVHSMRGASGGEVEKTLRKAKRHKADRSPNFLRRSEKVMTELRQRAFAQSLIQKIKHINRQAPPHNHSKEKIRNNKNASDRPQNAFLKSVSKRLLCYPKEAKGDILYSSGNKPPNYKSHGDTKSVLLLHSGQTTKRELFFAVERGGSCLRPFLNSPRYKTKSLIS